MKYTIQQFRKEFSTEEDCLQKVFNLKYGNLKICPSCDKETSFRRVTTRKCYQCTKCYHQFYPCKNTIFENSKTPLTYWFYAMFLFTVSKNGISAYELQRQLGVTYKTAWRILKQIRILLSENDTVVFTNESIVELDETFVGGKNKNRHKDKKVEKAQGRSFKDKVPVLGMLERSGKVKCFVIPDTSSKTIHPYIFKNIPFGTTIMTDEWTAYNNLNKFYEHNKCDHSKKIYVDGNAHTNGMENFWSNVKRTLNGSYIHVSKKYLQLYINECSFRFNNRKSKIPIFYNLMDCLSV